MTRSKTLLIGILAALAGAVMIAVLATRSANEPRTAAAPESAQSAASKSGPRTGLMDSSAKVSLTSASASDLAEAGEIILTLDIQPGWHVNANPASMEFLIPTVASGSADGEALSTEPRYPPGRMSEIKLGGKAIAVYDDGAQIRFAPEAREAGRIKDAGKLDLSVRVQACSDDGVCLAPSDLSITLDERGVEIPSTN